MPDGQGSDDDDSSDSNMSSPEERLQKSCASMHDLHMSIHLLLAPLENEDNRRGLLK